MSLTSVNSCFRRGESDPVRALDLRQGGLRPQPHLRLLRARHKRGAHPLVSECALQSYV